MQWHAESISQLHQPGSLGLGRYVLIRILEDRVAFESAFLSSLGGTCSRVRTWNMGLRSPSVSWQEQRERGNGEGVGEKYSMVS